MSNNQSMKEYKKRWREQNADKMKQQSKEYYQNNRDDILEKRRQYRADNPDKMHEIYLNYKQNHPDKLKETKRNTYEKHREQILEKQKQYQTLRVECCLCGESVRKYYLTQHQSTNKCKKHCVLYEGLLNTSTISQNNGYLSIIN